MLLMLAIPLVRSVIVTTVVRMVTLLPVVEVIAVMAVYGGDGHGDARRPRRSSCVQKVYLCVCVCTHVVETMCVCTCLQTWSRKLSVMNANMAA